MTVMISMLWLKIGGFTVIEKIMIKNYRIFEAFELDFNKGMNSIVDDNYAGKSTLLEAIHLALTSRINGRPLAYEFSPLPFQREGDRRLHQRPWSRSESDTAGDHH